MGDPGRRKGTYESFAQLPPFPADVSRLDWLREAKAQAQSELAGPAENAVTDLSSPALRARIGEAAPADLLEFTSDPSLRTRLPSATDAYFDLGDEVRAVEGGLLLHLVSDSQWVMHWSLYVGDNGESAIVASNYPVGFQLDDDDLAYWSDVPAQYFVCAGTFAEFAWRWWMDNEIFYAAIVEKRPLTDAQQAYLAGYGEPISLS